MSKKWILFIVVFSILGLVGCSSSTDLPPSNQVETENGDTQETTPVETENNNTQETTPIEPENNDTQETTPVELESSMDTATKQEIYQYYNEILLSDFEYTEKPTPEELSEWHGNATPSEISENYDSFLYSYYSERKKEDAKRQTSEKFGITEQEAEDIWLEF